MILFQYVFFLLLIVTLYKFINLFNFCSFLHIESTSEEDSVSNEIFSETQKPWENFEEVEPTPPTSSKGDERFEEAAPLEKNEKNIEEIAPSLPSLKENEVKYEEIAPEYSPKGDKLILEEFAPTSSLFKQENKNFEETAPIQSPLQDDKTSERILTVFPSEDVEEIAPAIFPSKYREEAFEEIVAPTPSPSKGDYKRFVEITPENDKNIFGEEAPSEDESKDFEEIALEPSPPPNHREDGIFEEIAPTQSPPNQDEEETDRETKPEENLENDNKKVINPLIISLKSNRDVSKDVPRETCVNKMPYEVCSTKFVKLVDCRSKEFDFYENCRQYCEFCVPDLRGRT